jgi:hypothetical protein
MTSSLFFSFVTLNLFQGPSCSQTGACGGKTDLAALRSISKIGRADKWTLKQVQGDGVCGG